VEIATRLLNAEGRVLKGEKMSRQHPAVNQQQQAMRLVKQLLGEFGLSPSSRSKVVASDPATEDPRSKKFIG
jgi:P27 family predicted phage terminase small subunit